MVFQYTLLSGGLFYNKLEIVHCTYMCIKGSGCYFKKKKNEFLSMMIVFVLANSVDPDEMPPYARIHLGHHSLPKNVVNKGLNWPC